MRLSARKRVAATNRANAVSLADTEVAQQHAVPRPAPAAASHFSHNFASVQVHASRDAAIRRKLIDDRGGDSFERHADRLAQQIVHEPVHDHSGTNHAADVPAPRRATSEASVDRQLLTSAVSTALETPGQPLDSATRAFMEPRFGSTFGDIRIHADARASRAAADVHARAFTSRNHIVFGEGEYVPHTTAGRVLLAHELTHVLQQHDGSGAGPLQRTPCTDERAPGPFKVAVIGAPGPGEISASHPYQFMNAARFAGVTRNTVWIVERTGYVAGGVDTGRIEADSSPGCVIWMTPATPLSSILESELPAASVSAMTVYSHGVPGQVALRYGWDAQGLPNYGISMSQVRSFNSSRFTSDATITFNSCNTGTAAEQGTLAQEMAYSTNRPVRAWTGRTSYAEVNDGSLDDDTAVHGSQMWRNSRPDFKEMGSRIAGHDPVLKTFSPPGARVGGFTSDFEIMTRLPESRHFHVPQNGTVVVRCSNAEYLRPERAALPTDRIGISLMLSEDWAIDPHIGHESLRADIPDVAIFSNLAAGQYYLEITAESTPEVDYETLSGDIAVDVREA